MNKATTIAKLNTLSIELDQARAAATSKMALIKASDKLVDAHVSFCIQNLEKHGANSKFFIEAATLGRQLHEKNVKNLEAFDALMANYGDLITQHEALLAIAIAAGYCHV